VNEVARLYHTRNEHDQGFYAVAICGRLWSPQDLTELVLRAQTVISEGASADATEAQLWALGQLSDVLKRVGALPWAPPADEVKP
jgi:hypothetical protein